MSFRLPVSSSAAGAVTLTCLLAATQASAFSITADSDLADWLGAAPRGVSADDWIPVAGQGIKYAVEDQTGNRNRYLGPGWGGQAYDAEAIYAQRSATHINIAVVTGRAPGASGYAAGDIAIDFGLDGAFDYGVVTLGDSTGIGDAGELFAVSAWDYGLWSAPGVEGDPTTTAFGLSHPATVAGGSKVADVAFSYDAMTHNGVGGLGIGEFGDAGRHYVIEASIGLDLFDPRMSSQAFLVHWTMACANDIVEVDPPARVPAPAPLALLLLGGLAAVGRGGAWLARSRPRFSAPAASGSKRPAAGLPVG